MVGVGLAEEAGLINALIRKIVIVAPRKAITFIIVAMGVLSSVASDAGYLVLIPLGAAAFLSLGRHPIAGLAAAFAGVAAVFGVNLIITPIDGVLTEITNDAIHLLNQYTIYLTANLYFSSCRASCSVWFAQSSPNGSLSPGLANTTGSVRPRRMQYVRRRGTGIAICGLWADRHRHRDSIARASSRRAAAKP
jgi:aminobenzoyl-glutamate transport protein